jgi:translation elongation factor EF-G
MGKIGVFRVHQGTMKKDMQLFVGDGKRPIKVGHLYQLQGKDSIEDEPCRAILAPSPRSMKSISTVSCTIRTTRITSTSCR